jgi:hypothetical protein
VTENRWKRWVGDPLFVFLALGAGLFGLHAWVGGGRGYERDARIVVTTADVSRIRSIFERQWNRPPTEVEVDNLVAGHIREEVLYREALALGLDRDDTIVRRRLVQKLEFVAEDMATLVPPTEDELEAWFQANADQYREPARISLVHVYLSPDRRGERTAVDAETLLAELREEPDRPIPWQSGDRFMLQNEYARKDTRELARLFGRAFAERLVELEPGSWQGPVQSGYGLHLVLVRERVESSLPELEKVRERVLTDVRADRRRLADEAFYRALRERYVIEIEDEAVGERLARAADTGEHGP